VKHLLAILGAVIASLVCAVTGAYVLWQFHSTGGLIGGVSLILLAVAIALPIPLHDGAARLKENVVLVVPTILDALKGGSRKTDPPADAPAKESEQ
jgi:hypothetical protein